MNDKDRFRRHIRLKYAPARHAPLSLQSHPKFPNKKAWISFIIAKQSIVILLLNLRKMKKNMNIYSTVIFF